MQKKIENNLVHLFGQKMPFLSTPRVKNVHVEVVGGQKRAKLCPRSHCTPSGLAGWAITHPQNLVASGVTASYIFVAVFSTDKSVCTVSNLERIKKKSLESCFLMMWNEKIGLNIFPFWSWNSISPFFNVKSLYHVTFSKLLHDCFWI